MGEKTLTFGEEGQGARMRSSRGVSEETKVGLPPWRAGGKTKWAPPRQGRMVNYPLSQG